jgi:hypothetical protein
MKILKKVRISALIYIIFCLLIFISCDDESERESHFIYFSITEPYTRIGGVECNIDNISGKITNIEPLPAGTNLKELKVWFVTNHSDEGVFVSGIKQESGVTVNDFSSPVEYEIRTKSESRKYVVSFTVSNTCNTQVGVKLEGYSDFVYAVNKDNSRWLSSSVRVSEVDFTSTSERKLKLCLFEVDLTDPSIYLFTTLPGNGDIWGIQNMADQVKAIENSGKHVLGAVNGDYFDNETGEPEGIVCRDGIYLKETFNNSETGSFFGIRNDGRASIGNYDQFLIIKEKFLNVIGGRQMLVSGDGPVAELTNDASLANRTAIGMSSLDLKTLYIVVVEALDADSPKGISLSELARCMITLGAGHAVNLDGGESSTFVVRGESNEFIALNRPDGPLRNVGNGLAIILK